MSKIVTLILFFMPVLSNAAIFSNGNFSSGHTDWHALGSVQIAEQVVMQTESGFDSVDSLSAVLVQGDDGSFWSGSSVEPFAVSLDSQWLYFDAKFEDLGIDANETSGSAFADALFVSLYDFNDDTKSLSFDPVIDFSKNGLGFLAFAFDISSLQGHEIALSFELFDENDGRDSRVTIDNVQFASAVPVPSAAILFASIIPLFGWRIRKN